MDLQITNHIREVENFKQSNQSHSYLKEEYYKQFVKVFNDTDFMDTEEKQNQFKMFYGKILDGSWK